ncbi:TetR/AcrR family transcriptional regulator [Cryptosporangium aurantiacum]|uniref:Transcriptional regulator, TetR family n=1 Tax=Cryptosporangium aurantiacum TaxID=134849 RepID=A0A1M7R4K5_9ACTN|nr:TetR/AcrR family transcriptional regulator [Cryptosporangium aurantiacum]SHN40171.1 transcriptional regulator, TetR family [Cryptosporangium aurantiacum]
MTPSRPLRADAIRNRAKILAAARDQISAHGVEVGMDEIAAAAGVAVGTLYRHFPNKTELIAAVLGDFTDQTAADAEAAGRRVSEGARAADEIAGFLGRVLDAAAVNHAAKAAAKSLGAYVGAPDAEQRAEAAMTQLIRAGQTEGDIYPDVTVGDIYLLVNTAPTDQPPPVRARWLALALRSISIPR